MSNYRVRQVLALGRMPERQRLFLVAIATWMNDDTNVVRVGVTTLMATTGQARNTFRTARRELEAAGRVISTSGGNGAGDLTSWHVRCLPDKGVNELDPLTVSDKGVKPGPIRGSNNTPEGGQPQRADQPKPVQGLDLRAYTSGSISDGPPTARPAPVDYGDLIPIIIEELKAATGATITADWARRVQRTVLDGQQVSNPAAYIRKAIQDEANPRVRFLPNGRPGYADDRDPHTGIPLWSLSERCRQDQHGASCTWAHCRCRCHVLATRR